MQRQSPSGPLEVQTLRFTISGPVPPVPSYLAAVNSPIVGSPPPLPVGPGAEIIAGVRIPRSGAVLGMSVRQRVAGAGLGNNAYAVQKADALTMSVVTTIGTVTIPDTQSAAPTTANGGAVAFGKVNAASVTPTPSPAVFVANDLLLVRITAGAASTAAEVDVVVDFVENDQ
jgi:hypothetical protein